jgi:tRNASer (uridine44-2'-O)-methyltransferase
MESSFQPSLSKTSKKARILEILFGRQSTRSQCHFMVTLPIGRPYSSSRCKMSSRRRRIEQPLLPMMESSLTTRHACWWTSPSYSQSSLFFSPTSFYSVTDALLENPNLNSSHLFRADILYDSTGILKTNEEKEDFCRIEPRDQNKSDNSGGQDAEKGANESLPPLAFTGFALKRTVLRRLVPRKPQLDRSLLQTCHVYTSSEDHPEVNSHSISQGDILNNDISQPSVGNKDRSRRLYRQSAARATQHLVVYLPHVDPLTGRDIPWYHPPLKSIAFLYSSSPSSTSENQEGAENTLSIHIQTFQANSSTDRIPSISERVHRTLLSLLSTTIRLARNTLDCAEDMNLESNMKPVSATRHIKDNIIPEHLVQNTYSRLKSLYAVDLINRWVEKTDPTKHVFEDLSIAAFLIELWRKMYGSNPADFPGFVDIACGNGLLVYILIMEGLQGWGFDARVRRTWSIFPENVTTQLKETVCIPRPFLNALHPQDFPLPDGLSIHDGVFEADTFIISNHADELTTWTPLLAALSSPGAPLPWLAIPCCSHALSGAAHRYPSGSKNSRMAKAGNETTRLHGEEGVSSEGDEQPRSGDLSALRAAKARNKALLEQGQSSQTTSTYASLVNHVMHLATRIDPTQDVQQTLMRIPSTRNIGIVGGQLRGVRVSGERPGLELHETVMSEGLSQEVHNIVGEECGRSGGVAEAAKLWMEAVIKARGTTRHKHGC